MRAWLGVFVLALGACGSTASTSPDEDSPVTIAFAGDVHTADPVDPTDPAYAGAFQQLREADVAMVNLETAVATAGTPADKRFLFRADPAILDKLASWGVDLVTMANNHALDYGRDGLEETLLARDDANLGVLGVGRTADQALSPAQITVRGSTITFLAAKLDDDPTADPTAAWAATKTLSGVASASDPAALLAGRRAALRPRRRRGVPALGHPGRFLPERRAGRSGRGAPACGCRRDHRCAQPHHPVHGSGRRRVRRLWARELHVVAAEPER